MSTQPNSPRALALAAFKLQFPQSLATYHDYASAQRTVDFLSDEGFPVQNCMIVGTDLKQLERITGRLTWGRVATAGAASGLWFGLLIGLLLSFFGSGSLFAVLAVPMLFGLAFGVIWSLLGYGLTRGQRDFSSITQVVATKYEVLVEHKVAAEARELLARLPAATPDPFA